MRRVVSLLPAATEIACALGAGDELVGVSHECDFPASVRGLPRLTRARIGAVSGSRAIDRAVHEVVAQALAVFEVDAAGLAALKPDVILTQDLCDVCAVTLSDVRAALRRLAGHPVEIVSLSPMRLADVLADVERVGAALGREEPARRLRADLEARIEAVRRRAANGWQQPRVLTVEWVDPVMLGGTWMPELVLLAGGIAVGASAGMKAPQPTAEQLLDLDPEVVLLKPCGFSLDATLAALPTALETLPIRQWPAAAHGRIYCADGSSYFNRPGPRLVESLEILAGCVHPGLFADFRQKHASAARRRAADGSLCSFDGGS